MIKRYLCIVAILSIMMGYGQTICYLGKEYKSSTLDGKTSFIPTGNGCTVAPAIGAALQPMGLVDTSVRTQIQSLGTAELQAEIARKQSMAQTQAQVQAAQAAQNELIQAQQAQAQAQQALDAAQQAMFLAISNVTANTQINLSAMQAALATAEQHAIRAQMHAQSAANQLGVSLPNTSASNSTLRIWFLDNDKDGWYGITYKSSFNPGAGWSTSRGAGQDCNDNDPTKNYDCSFGQIVGWYLDNDGDGYFAVVQPSATRPTTPPGNWTTARTKGPDCNDNLFSADNSVCTTPTTPNTNPCAQIKAQIANADWIAKLNILKGKTALEYESGYLEQLDTQSPFLELTPGGDDSGHNLNFPITKTTKGYMHTHPNPYTRIGNDGDDYIQPIHMFSPADIIQMLKLTANAYQNQIPMPDVYGAMVSSTGTYQLKFTGDVNMLIQNMSNATVAMNTYKNKIERVDDVYREIIEESNKDNELGILNFMQTIFKINGLELLKIEDDNSVSKITKGTDGKVVKTPCAN